MSELHFEDFRPGDEHELGEVTTTEAEIVSFATDWDPQFFHTDPVTAPAGPFGLGVVASGWQICAAWQRLYDEALLNRAAVRGLTEAEDIRWFQPWRPGGILRARAVVLDPRAPGVVTVRAESFAPDGALAFSMVALTPVASRP